LIGATGKTGVAANAVLAAAQRATSDTASVAREIDMDIDEFLVERMGIAHWREGKEQAPHFSLTELILAITDTGVRWLLTYF
jgi:hypothetical protein